MNILTHQLLNMPLIHVVTNRDDGGERVEIRSSNRGQLHHALSNWEETAIQSPVNDVVAMLHNVIRGQLDNGFYMFPEAPLADSDKLPIAVCPRCSRIGSLLSVRDSDDPPLMIHGTDPETGDAVEWCDLTGFV